MKKYKCSAPAREHAPTEIIEASGPYEARKIYSRLRAVPVFAVIAVLEQEDDSAPYMR